MNARPADPRDTKWEVSSPAYRVYFWRRRSGGYETEEFELDGATDVAEVLGWAEQRAEARTFTVYVVVDALGERGLVQLAGVDPTASS
jgi:hypothetical protein